MPQPLPHSPSPSLSPSSTVPRHCPRPMPPISHVCRVHCPLPTDRVYCVECGVWSVECGTHFCGCAGLWDTAGHGYHTQHTVGWSAECQRPAPARPRAPLLMGSWLFPLLHSYRGIPRSVSRSTTPLATYTALYAPTSPSRSIYKCTYRRFCPSSPRLWHRSQYRRSSVFGQIPAL